MLFRKDPATVFRIGAFCMALGALSLRFLHRSLGVNENVADLISGILYGLAIGSMIVSMVMRRRPRA